MTMRNVEFEVNNKQNRNYAFYAEKINWVNKFWLMLKSLFACANKLFKLFAVGIA